MNLSFRHQGLLYTSTPIRYTSISAKAICIDGAFYNTNVSKLSKQILPPPPGCRGAFQCIKYGDMQSPQDLKNANRFLDLLLERYSGFLIPNIDHRWHSRIASMMDQSKLVYTALEHQPNLIYLVQRDRF